MKNLSLILNAVLLVAVAVLFYLHFSSGSPKKADSNGGPIGDLVVAYVNSDSLVSKYEYMKDTRAVLEAKAKKLDADLNNRANALRGEIAAYQRNVSNMTIGQAKALEEDLGKKQQNLQMYQQSLGQEMGAEEAKVNKELYDRITTFLKLYSEENGIQAVLKYDISSDLLYGKDALDITNVVLDGLNKEYTAEKNGTKAKADSTTKK